MGKLESERRGEKFVTRKIARSAANIAAGLQDKLALGRLDTERDWGFAGDYVQAMQLMMSCESPDDFVIATGIKHTVQDFVQLAFEYVHLDWSQYVIQDERFMRPTEVPSLCGDASKAKQTLGWSPTMSFQNLVKRMVESEVRALKQNTL